MAQNTRGAAVSHVGRVRSNNQDSGYSGHELFLVADGMGGHAGGDVASAIVTNHVKAVDGQYDDAQSARRALADAMLRSNELLIETVADHPELTGMGTTASALLRVGDQMAIAHIGDSRIYLCRDGEVTQISTDHTFVQRLVETGRITEEEALVHPRRSVLMRVLGDVDAHPQVDSWVVDTHPGDRWLICSDGLSGVVKPDTIGRSLAMNAPPKVVADRLLKQALDGGAPDNVTVVIVDIDRGEQPHEPVTVGSAAAPLALDETSRPRTARVPVASILLHPVRATETPTHFEPQTDDYLSELIDEDQRRARRRRVLAIVSIVVAAAVIVAGCVLGYQWTQTRYYVGSAPDGQVAIFKGVQQSLGPISLSHVYKESGVAVSLLSSYAQQQVEQTINADSYADAHRILAQLTNPHNRGNQAGG